MLRTKRVEKQITLRDLSFRTDIDVAYLSRVERETIAPPSKEDLLESINEALELSSEEGKTLIDQASMDNEKFPKDIAGAVKEMVGIPLLLRSMANKKLNEDQIRKITSFINDNY